jgi:hypothetical protein
MLTSHITMTLLYDGAKWLALFERQNESGRSVCELFCGTSEPLIGEIYALLLQHYWTLEFSQPVVTAEAEITASRPLNFKRMQRESRRLQEDSGTLVSVREATRAARALQKTLQTAAAKAAREAHTEYKYRIKQEQKKAKQRGH